MNAAAASPPRILIVEDDAVVARDIQETVERLGYGVAAVVHTGEEAVSASETLTSLDLALMDIRLEGSIDGTEAAGILGERTGVPIVYLTAHTDDHTLARAGRTNPSGYVVKPFDERDLRSAIELALARARIEGELLLSRERYRRLFESDLVGHGVTSPDGRLVEGNPALLRILGFPSIEEARAADLGGLYSKRGDRDALVQRIRESGRLDKQEIDLVRADGTPITVIANAVGMFDRSGELVEIHGHVIDVTEERALQRQSALARKREAIGRMAGAACHQFNNVLSAIQVQVDRMLARTNLDEGARSEAWGIRDAARRGEELAVQLLHTAGADAGEREVVDPNEVVQQLLFHLSSITGPGVSVRTRLQPCGVVKIDPTLLQRVLTDLAENSIEAVGVHGTIRITSRACSLSSLLAVESGTVPPGAYSVIEVADSGPGIAVDERERVFDPYFSTKAGKLGLGLSRALGILRRAGGFLDITSPEGGGATFHVFLPAVDPSSGVADADDLAVLGGTETILVVDDDEAVRGVTSRLLARYGYRVLSAENGEEALARLDESGAAVDLVLTDLIMPRMNGADLIRRMRERGGAPPALVVSSLAGPGDLAEGLLPPDVEAVRKPFAPGVLLKEVRRALRAAKRP